MTKQISNNEQNAQFEDEKQIKLPVGKCIAASVKLDENDNIIVHLYGESKNAENCLHLVMSKGDSDGNSWDIYESKNVIKLALTVKKDNMVGVRKWHTFVVIAARLFKHVLSTTKTFDNHD